MDGGAVAAIGHFDVANLTDMAVDETAAGASSWLPNGYLGIWASIPFAIWFFLAIEGVPLAAEETANPERNVPRGIIAGMAVLLVTCVTVLILTTGAGGAEAMSASGNPLVEALGDGTAAKVVNYIGLAGLIASFFSIIYAYSRQLFALSRAGYLPKVLSVTNSRKAPTLALLVPGLVGFLLSLTGQGAMLLNMAVFGAALSYVLMMISHIVLRRLEPREGDGLHDRHHRFRPGHRGVRGHRDIPGRPRRRGLVPGRVRRLHALLRGVQPPPVGGQLAR